MSIKNQAAKASNEDANFETIPVSKSVNGRMAEFEINVNQSLVEKTLNNLDFNPFTVLKFPKNEGVLHVLEVEKVEEIIDDVDRDFKDYTKNCLELVETEYNLHENKRDPTIKPAFIESEESNGLLKERYEDALSLAADMVSNYVVQHSEKFADEPDLIEEAKLIAQRQGQYIHHEVVLGFGKFFKRVYSKIKKAVKTIWNWIKKQIKKVIGFGKPQLKELTIYQWNKPSIELGNPIVVNGLNISLHRLVVHIPYYIKFPWKPIKWRSIRITANDKLGAKVDGIYQIEQAGLKIFVRPKFTKLKVKVRLLGKDFSIGLTKITNKILSKKRFRFEIYDVSDLAKPIQVKGLKYEVKSVVPTSISTGLKLGVFIDVSN